MVKLPTGTVSFESISEERLLGKVDCEPRIISSGEAEQSKRVREGGRKRVVGGWEGREEEEEKVRKGGEAVENKPKIICSEKTERSNGVREKRSSLREKGEKG